MAYSNIITPPPSPGRTGGWGIIIERFLSFVSFFVSLSARLRENGWTDLHAIFRHEIFREGVEWPWDDLFKFWVNSGKPRDAAMLGAGFVVPHTTACFIYLMLKCLPRRPRRLLPRPRPRPSVLRPRPWPRRSVSRPRRDRGVWNFNLGETEPRHYCASRQPRDRPRRQDRGHIPVINYKRSEVCALHKARKETCVK